MSVHLKCISGTSGESQTLRVRSVPVWQLSLGEGRGHWGWGEKVQRKGRGSRRAMFAEEKTATGRGGGNGFGMGGVYILGEYIVTCRRAAL